LLGTDVARGNPRLREAPSPVGDDRLLYVGAIVPDVAVLHVQRADDRGGCHAWGNLGVSEEAALAAKHLIVVAEEIVERAAITSDPNRVLVPPHRVSAVVREPGGAHPSPVQGYYGRDHDFFREYHAQTKSVEDDAAWRERWIRGVPDRAAYLQELGEERWASLAVKDELFAADVNYSAT
jgi:glutaconate CoA-transferase subunit A